MIFKIIILLIIIITGTSTFFLFRDKIIKTFNDIKNKITGKKDNNNSISTEEENSDTIESFNNKINLTYNEMTTINGVYEKLIDQLENLNIIINRDISDEKAITENTVSQIHDIFNIVKKGFDQEDELFLNQIIFNIDQYIQNKEIAKLTDELERLKYIYEEKIRQKIGKNMPEIKSIKNYYNDLDLNIHNVSPINVSSEHTEYNESGDNSLYETTSNINDCIVSCKKDINCYGITFNGEKSQNNCYKNINKLDNTVNITDPYNKKIKTWEKNKGFIVYVNNGCLNYHEDILIVKKDSPIDSWLDCHNLNIGMLNFDDEMGDKIMDLAPDDIKLVKPNYKNNYIYTLGKSDDITKKNEEVINKMLEDLLSPDSKLSGIRLPMNMTARKLIFDKIKVIENDSNKKEIKYININSSYDLNRCSTNNRNQIFELEEIKTVSDYNRLVRSENELRENYHYLGKEEKVENNVVLPSNTNIIEKNKICKKACDENPFCDDYVVRKKDNKDYECISNPYINYSHINQEDNQENRDLCQQACENDYLCEGVNFTGTDKNNMKCQGYKSDGINKKILTTGSERKYGWKKHNDFTIRKINNVPTPFYVLKSKKYLDHKNNNCVTITNSDLSIEPCNLSLNQRFNASNKTRMC